MEILMVIIMVTNLLKVNLYDWFLKFKTEIKEMIGIK